MWSVAIVSPFRPLPHHLTFLQAQLPGASEKSRRPNCPSTDATSTHSPSELSMSGSDIPRSYSTLWSTSTYCKSPNIPFSPSFSLILRWFLAYIYGNLKTSLVMLFTPHIAQRRCAVRLFLSHPSTPSSCQPTMTTTHRSTTHRASHLPHSPAPSSVQPCY